MPTAYPDSVLFPGRVVEGWTVDRLLGHGASALVYEVHNAQGRAALKLFAPWVSQDSTGVHRIELQVNSLGGVEHPHLCRILSGGRVGPGSDAAGRLYLVLEFIEGNDLAALIDGTQPWGTDQVLSLGVALAEALQVLHARGLIHRDVKPQNVMIEAVSNRVVLCDTGVVRDIDGGRLTESHEFLGTLQYAAPEHVFRSPPDAVDHPAVDVYGIGSTMLFAATGHDPYPGIRNRNELARTIAQSPPTIDLPASEHRLASTIRHALLRTPSARPSVQELRIHLLSLREPIRASPVGIDAAKAILASDPLLRDAIAQRQRREEEMDSRRNLWVAIRQEHQARFAHFAAELGGKHIESTQDFWDSWANEAEFNRRFPGFGEDASTFGVLLHAPPLNGAGMWTRFFGRGDQFELIMFLAEHNHAARHRILLDSCRYASGSAETVLSHYRAAVEQMLSDLAGLFASRNAR